MMINEFIQHKAMSLSTMRKLAQGCIHVWINYVITKYGCAIAIKPSENIKNDFHQEKFSSMSKHQAISFHHKSDEYARFEYCRYCSENDPFYYTAYEMSNNIRFSDTSLRGGFYDE